MLTRRAVLSAGGGVFLSAVLRGRAGAADVVEIHMKSDPAGGVVGFDPVGVLLQPGQTVRWICDLKTFSTKVSERHFPQAIQSPSTGLRTNRNPRGTTMLS